MKPVLAVVSLALGLVLGLSAGMVIRVPEALFNPGVLLPEEPPDACLQVVDAAEELAEVTSGYLTLIQDTYVPVLEGIVEQGTTEQPSTATGSVTDPGSLIDALLAAEQQMADLSDRTATAMAVLTESGVVCRGERSE